MESKQWTTINKSGWPRGPWDAEPDKVQWTDGATGFPCLAVRQAESGHWCGYVGVAEGHAAYGRSYSALDVIRVHGGLTYADYCELTGGPAHAICHEVGEGEEDRLYWLGFDCHHGGDAAPGRRSLFEKIGLQYWHGTYRTLDYVRRECAQLAHQLADPELRIEGEERLS